MNLKLIEDEAIDTAGLVAHYKLYAGPSGVNKLFDYSLNGNEGTWQGAELVTDGIFAAWSGFADPDNEPSNWDVTITGGADGNNKLIDATNKCQLISDGTLVEILQNVLTVGKTYTVSINVTAAVDGSIAVFMDGGATPLITIGTGETGVATATGTATNKNILIKRLSSTGAVDITFTDVSVREVLQGSYPGVLFDGAEDKITVAPDPSIDAKDKTALTIVAWINPASDGGDNIGIITDKGDIITGRGYHFQVIGEISGTVRLRVEVEYDGTSAQSSSAVGADLPINQWSHVVVVFNEDSDNKIKIYINAIPQALANQIAGVGAIVDDSGDVLTIGDTVNGRGAFDGLIDDVRIYNVAKSAAFARDDFEATRSRYGV